MIKVFTALFSICLMLLAQSAPAAAQASREVGEMRLYIQQLEAQVRDLTGQNEQLRFELRKMRAQAGTGDQPTAGIEPGIVRGTINPQNNSSVERGAPPQDLGTLGVGQDGSVAQDDPLIVPDGQGAEVTAGDEMQPGQPIDQPVAGGAGAPLDLSALAGGQQGGQIGGQDTQTGIVGVQPVEGGQQLTASISGDARDEYDLAYGYVLTGDFPLAEAHFRAWISAFPSNKLADDARFWLAESQLRQGKHQDAASGFLDLHKRVPNNSKGPDTLIKLGIALVGLGERDAACATFSEVAKKYPDATGATMSRAASEQQRAKC